MDFMDATVATVTCNDARFPLVLLEAWILHYPDYAEKQLFVHCLCKKFHTLPLGELVAEAEALGCETITCGDVDIDTRVEWLAAGGEIAALACRPLVRSEQAVLDEYDAELGTQPTGDEVAALWAADELRDANLYPEIYRW
jgi:hypothetical protein